MTEVNIIVAPKGKRLFIYDDQPKRAGINPFDGFESKFPHEIFQSFRWIKDGIVCHEKSFIIKKIDINDDELALAILKGSLIKEEVLVDKNYEVVWDNKDADADHIIEYYLIVERYEYETCIR